MMNKDNDKGKYQKALLAKRAYRELQEADDTEVSLRTVLRLINHYSPRYYELGQAEELLDLELPGSYNEITHKIIPLCDDKKIEEARDKLQEQVQTTNSRLIELNKNVQSLSVIDKHLLKKDKKLEQEISQLRSEFLKQNKKLDEYISLSDKVLAAKERVVSYVKAYRAYKHFKDIGIID